MKKRIFIYGFGPYDQYRQNVTAAALTHLRASDCLRKKIFKVEFAAGVIERSLNRARPDIVIGLGQHPRARKIRIERKAVNAVRRRRNARLLQIAPSSERTIFATLALPASTETTVTYNAGTYACNFSMWVVGQWCRSHGAVWVFLHVPKGADPRRVARYLDRLCRRLRR